MGNYLEARVSLFATVLEQEPYASPRVYDVLSDIRSGTYLSQTTPLLFILKEEGFDAYNRAKSALPAFTPAAQLRTRSRDVPLADAVLAYTGVVYFDIDHLDTQALLHLRTELARWPCLVFYFLSPSQQGLKVGLAADGIHDETTYAQAWKQGATRFAAIGVAVDSAPKSPKSLCFVSTDGLTHISNAITPFHVEPPAPRAPRSARPFGGSANEARVRSALEAIPNADCDYEAYVQIGMALHSENQGWQELWDDWASAWPTYSQRDQDAKWKSFDGGKGVGLGTLFDMAKRHGWHDPLRRERYDVPPGADAHRDGHHAQTEEPADRPWITMADVMPEDIPWLWWPYMIRGALCMLDGDPGQGKSVISLAIATHLSLGKPLPDQQGELTLPTMRAHSLFFANEDALGSIVRRRLDAMGADLSRIHFFQGHPEKTGLSRERFTFQDMPLLDATIQEFIATYGEPPAFIVLDPIQAYFGRGVSMNNAADTRALLEPLAAIARQYGCSITCIRHASKGGGSDGTLSAMMRGSGATDITGVARTVLFAQEHPYFPTQALLMHVKANASIRGRALVFNRSDGEGNFQFDWKGVTRIDAEEIAGSGRGMNPRERLRTFFWVERTLEGGYPVSSKDLMLQAEEYGFNEKHVYAAKAALGIEARRVGFGKDGYVDWRLPGLKVIAPPASILPINIFANEGGSGGCDPSAKEVNIEYIYNKESIGSMERMDISDTYRDTPVHPVEPILPSPTILPLVTPARAARANNTLVEGCQGVGMVQNGTLLSTCRVPGCGGTLLRVGDQQKCARCIAVTPLPASSEEGSTPW